LLLGWVAATPVTAPTQSGAGGLIAPDPDGNVATPVPPPGTFRIVATTDGTTSVRIFKQKTNDR
jgi:hypothetical protein